ncbi:MAG: DUF2207 domain-containing protein [Acholeplasmataceae bacterium]|nr:DUF2207 domain-containing protein [Acholeplasmataceae bacterium]
MFVIGHKVFSKKDIRRVAGIILLLVAIFIIALYNRVSIDTYQADITLDEAGNMSVVEQWDMTYKEGLFSFIGLKADPMRVRFRDIGFNKYVDDYNFPTKASNLAYFDESSVDVSVFKDGVDVTSTIRIGYSFENDRDELGYPITCEPQSNYCESIFIDAALVGGLVGNFTFIYEYTILGAVTQYSDTSELNWVLLEYAESKIKNGQVNINLPETLSDMDDLYLWGHGLSNGRVSIESPSRLELTFKNMKQDDFLEFRILTPNSVFPNILSTNIFINPDINFELIYLYEDDLVRQTNQSINAAIVILIVSVSVSLFMMVFLYIYNKRHFKIFETEDFGDYLREPPSHHSPAEVGYLYRYKKTETEDITATLLDLISRDYIDIIDSKVNQITENVSYELRLNEKKSLDDLKSHEMQLIDWFFKTIAHGNSVTTKQIEDYSSYRVDYAREYLGESVKFTQLVASLCNQQDFFDSTLESHKSQARSIIALPVLVFIIIVILSQIFWVNIFLEILILVIPSVWYLYFISTRKRRSKNGQILFNKWDAFKHYLEDFGSFEDDPIPSIAVWEHYLAFATTFGIADQVMDQLKVKIEQEKMNLENSKFISNSYAFDSRSRYLYRRLHRTFDKARSNTNYRISQAAIQSSASSFSSSIRGTGSKSSSFSSRPSSFGSRGGFGGRSSGRSGGFSGGSSRGGGRGGGRSR